MAKVLGLTNTTIRGKIGNTVFYTRKAQALARMYQPVISNPKTELQTRQRSKMQIAVDINRKIREGVKNIVGTGSGKFEYQGLQKILMNSALLKQYQSPTNATTGSSRASFLSGLNLRNIMDAVGDSYKREALNIFDPGVTIGAQTLSLNGNVQLLNANVLAFILQQDGSFNQVWHAFGTTINPGSYFFGCDYELGDTLVFSSIVPSATTLVGQAIATVSQHSLSITPVDINDVAFNGTRIRGMVYKGSASETADATFIAQCGAGWKYYYKIDRPTVQLYIGSGIPVSGLISGAVQTAMLYNMCFVIASAVTSPNTAIQVLKGYSYNTYSPHDAVVES